MDVVVQAHPRELLLNDLCHPLEGYVPTGLGVPIEADGFAGQGV
jgi:hypothetical protein